MKQGARNAANPAQVKEQESTVRRTREQELEEVKKLLRDPAFRRFVWRYLGFCGVYRSSFTGSSETFFLEGKREVGLQLLDDVTKAAPEAYLEMMKENKES